LTIDISIIIPTLNEEQVLGKTLGSLENIQNCEVIVVDGGSSDTTLTLAQKTDCIIFSSPGGRGRQMNKGAAKARGEVLLFLHADTLLPGNFPGLILDATRQPAFVAGAFSLAIDSPKRSLAVIAWFANLRSRGLQLPYGDQALFINSSMFRAMGGFPELEIMEDFIFMQKLKKKGKVVILSECALTSARRWQNMGIIRTTLINQFIVCGHCIGIPSAILAGWYRRMRGMNQSSRNK
jgi:rSAM/selenodomain-associated transferase 2